MKEYEIKSKEQVEIIDMIMKSKQSNSDKVYFIKAYLTEWITKEDIEKIKL